MRPVYIVLGGTGFLGSRIARHLLEAGHAVRIAARHPEKDAALLAMPGAEPVRADLFEPATLEAALRGAEGAVNATSLYREAGDLTFEAVHVEGAARFARLARQANVRLIQVSGIGADANSSDAYIRARGRGEAAVRQACPEAIVVRPSALFGPGDALLSSILRTVRRLPVYPLFGRGDTRMQPVHVDDVAEAIVQVLRLDEPSRCYELGGPRVYAYRELVSAVARAAGEEVRLVPMPFAIWQALAAVGERVPAAPITRAQVALVREDNVAHGDVPGFAELGISPRDVEGAVRDE